MTADGLVIELVDRYDDELEAAVSTLLPQLSSTAFRAELLAEVVSSPASSLFIARIDGSIIGMCTLATFPIPTGIRSWIEDVVVDQHHRGKGVAGALVAAALGHARALGAKSVDLTSRPEREAANRLYQQIGFVRRATNVYRIDLQGPEGSNGNF